MRDDLFTVRRVYGLVDGVQFGTLTAEYRARRYRRASALGSADGDPDTNLAEPETYLVSCKLRLSVPNAAPLNIAPGKILSYASYPVIVSSAVRIDMGQTPPPGTDMALRDYSPRSLNASVNTERYDTASKDQGLNQTHSTGSSSSTTSTSNYSVLPINDSWGVSSTSSSMKEDSKTTSEETGTQAGASDTMSIKDWATYSRVDANYDALTWIWGQEYPWDCLQFGDADQLPQFVIRRMWDGANLFPPSSLSQFGVDFVSSATWEVKAGTSTPVVSFHHDIDCVTATHKLTETPPNSGKYSFSASLNHSSTLPVSLPSDPIDLEKLALAPVGGAAAAVNLQHDRFRVPPATGSAFAIRSRGNNLLVRGSGFDGAMTADLAAGPATLKLWFKVADQRAYRVVFRHWRDGKDPCVLTIRMPDGTVLTKFVDDPQAEGGEANYLRIDLRNNSYASTSYHDYLMDGMNVIEVSIAKPPGSTDCKYAVSAIAIA